MHPRLWSYFLNITYFAQTWTVVYLLSFPKSHLSDFRYTLIFEKNLSNIKLLQGVKKLEFQLSLARRGGLMVSVLVSGLSGLGSSPGRGHCVVFLSRTLYFHIASLHPGTYNWVLANLMLGYPCDGLASHPGGSRNTPSHFMLRKPG